MLVRTRSAMFRHTIWSAAGVHVAVKFTVPPDGIRFADATSVHTGGTTDEATTVTATGALGPAKLVNITVRVSDKPLVGGAMTSIVAVDWKVSTHNVSPGCGVQFAVSVPAVPGGTKIVKLPGCV
ncbi:MAG: hypothetical protein IPI73_28455 [Betaproteobacteria bacterium]|nr:hypothetical protein [Betaproteobacteria bacterium]